MLICAFKIIKKVQETIYNSLMNYSRDDIVPKPCAKKESHKIICIKNVPPNFIFLKKLNIWQKNAKVATYVE